MSHDCITQRKDVWTGVGTTLENRQIADSTWKISIEAPEFAARVASGKFVMLRLISGDDPLLGRPFAIYDADKTSGRVEVVYAVVGKGTKRLTALRPGDQLRLWGPLGNGWGVAQREKAPKNLVLVAGGVGNAPFYLFIKEQLEAAKKDPANAPKITYIFGARSAERLSCVEEFRALGVDVRIATEDGSVGTKGFVTDVLPEILPEDVDPAEVQLLCCGPSPMLRALAKYSEARGFECWTSLESPMACGLGICFSCVVDWKTDDGTWDYKRTCVDGPVFDASRLRWD